MQTHTRIITALTLWAVAVPLALAEGVATPTGLGEIGARLGAETEAAYNASPFAALSENYFNRFSLDPDATVSADEVAVTADWVIHASEAHPLLPLMAGYLAEFFEMAFALEVPVVSGDSPDANAIHLVVDTDFPLERDAFEIIREEGRIIVRSGTPEGVRDGVVRLVDHFGFRSAPFIALGEQHYHPRLAVRLGVTPRGGTHRDLVFQGYNAVFSGGGSIFHLSTSEAIPQLNERRIDGALEAANAARADAHRHGLKTFAFLDMRQKFPADDPIFEAHPEIRGALTWQADGEYVLCTEHPLVKQWLTENITAMFESDPELDGVTLINGGEGFYHCYMRPFGVERGRTNCERCDAHGAEQVVANLANNLAEAARAVTPHAEVIVWPYSAAHVWSADPNQEGMIELLGPGAALLTEVEKDEFLDKPEGVRKALWDYSIDMIDLGPRARAQLAATQAVDIPMYLKSEPELGFEAPRLPHIPCMDRWLARADALGGSGATGAFVFPAFRPNYGTSAAEVAKFAWWAPVPDPDGLLELFAARIAGAEAGPHVRAAWKAVSDAIPWSPELPPYYTGPYYLGPAHPMIADPDAEVPEVFYGLYLFMAEIMDSEGLKTRPTYFTSPRGDVPVFGRYYREMERLLKEAADHMDTAAPLVPERNRLMFDAENSPVQWFYRTARTHANFYEAAQLRDALLPLRTEETVTEEQRADAALKLARWREILVDERENTERALPLVEADVRLDFYYGSDHTFPHAADMIRAKLEILDGEINEFLPEVAQAIGID